MAITFDQVPTANRVPGTYAEVDGSRALSAQPGELHRVLLIGTKLAAGSAPADQVVEVSSEFGGDPLFGTASMAADMVRAFKKLNPNARLFVIPVLEAGGGTAATKTLTLAGTATAEGPLTARVGDVRVTVSIPVGTTAAVAAGLLNTAFGNEPRTAATAAVVGAVLTFTARHKGEGGNAVTVEAETLPAGITATAAAGVAGATNPSIATALANVDDATYDTIAIGYGDATNLGLLAAEVKRRWTPLVKLPAHGIAAVPGTLGAMVAVGSALNSEHLTVMEAGLSPTPPWIWAAQTAARDAQQTDAQPNRPRNGLTLDHCEAPKPADRLDATERNALLYDGISTHKVGPDGKVMIERLITTYQVNASSVADATYLAVETVRNLADYYKDCIQLGAEHARDLIAPDGTNVDPGVPVVTPKMMRGKLIARYRGRERRGLVKDVEGFARDLVVELPSNDVERMNAHVMPRLVQGLVTLAFKLSFQLG